MSEDICTVRVWGNFTSFEEGFGEVEICDVVDVDVNKTGGWTVITKSSTTYTFPPTVVVVAGRE